MDNEGCGRVAPMGEPAEESQFWQRYWEAVRRRGVKPGKEKWYELHCLRFIRWLKPRRLREAVAKDVTEWLRLMAGQPDTEVWKLRQAEKALRVLFQTALVGPRKLIDPVVDEAISGSQKGSMARFSGPKNASCLRGYGSGSDPRDTLIRREVEQLRGMKDALRFDGDW